MIFLPFHNLLRHAENKKKTEYKDDPGTVSLQLDGWIANHYGYAGLLINDVTPHWCVFLLFSRKNLGACSFPLFSSDLSGFRQGIMHI